MRNVIKTSTKRRRMKWKYLYFRSTYAKWWFVTKVFINNKIKFSNILSYDSINIYLYKIDMLKLETDKNKI